MVWVKDLEVGPGVSGVVAAGPKVSCPLGGHAEGGAGRLCGVLGSQVEVEEHAPVTCGMRALLLPPTQPLPWQTQLPAHCSIPTHPAPLPTTTPNHHHPQCGEYLRLRGVVRMRMAGQAAAAAADFSTAMPLLKEAGAPVSDALFNRGMCHMWVRVAHALAS